MPLPRLSGFDWSTDQWAACWRTGYIGWSIFCSNPSDLNYGLGVFESREVDLDGSVTGINSQFIQFETQITKSKTFISSFSHKRRQRLSRFSKRIVYVLKSLNVLVFSTANNCFEWQNKIETEWNLSMFEFYNVFFCTVKENYSISQTSIIVVFAIWTHFSENFKQKLSACDRARSCEK